MTSPDQHALSGAYAAHALEGPEREAFETHLRHCESCADEVADFAATLARLAAAEATAAPPAMEERTMAAIHTVRQLPAADPPAAAAPAPPRTRRLPGTTTRRWAAVGLAASLALTAVVGAIAVDQHDQADRAQAQTEQLRGEQARFAALLTAPDARTRTATAAGGSGNGTVVWSESRNEAGFLATGLPPLGAGSAYQLWYDDSGTARPAGLLHGSDGALLLDGPIDGAGGIGVTVEPATGSARPTSTPVLLFPLTAQHAAGRQPATVRSTGREAPVGTERIRSGLLPIRTAERSEPEL
ncbi:anti-sigma factor domain-containing protein [Kitasatospora sp. NPDC088346]|uniref:anti-sigma factor n=1 Tax=Kitasatospora sp. NPDC088346 TaxID=3364073 RepID=UPI00381EB04E